jgi:uncharacterized membrane protein YqaE (UPF0057 family)
LLSAVAGCPIPFTSYKALPSADFITHSDICKIILAIILPPLGVFLERGCGSDLLINIFLTILGFIPGIIHALFVISLKSSSE